jgi:putative hydroxymethylpyrimidine transport system substrate-binding protein
MKVVASLAAVLALTGLGGCGGDGAEPGASEEACERGAASFDAGCEARASAVLVLDFQPNAVHAGIYSALADGEYADRGVELEVREPSSSSDAPKLLEAGRADFAILDIHDLAIARERGFDLVAIAPIVQRPLAAVIAGEREAVREPADLEGGGVGVTGLPSDEAVLDSVLEGAGADPAEVERITIGFEAVPQLSAGRLDAATAFWNAEGVTLRRAGVPTREFRVDDYGAPRYPELVLVTTGDQDQALGDDVAAATATGYDAVLADPAAALDDLLAGNEGLDPAEQEAQLDALLEANAFSPVGEFDAKVLGEWADWDLEHGIVDAPIDIEAAFQSVAP